MAGTRTKRTIGRIIIVQETRFRLVGEAGQGMLFTLAHNAHTSMADLHQFHQAGALVVVEYTGEPNLASGGAHAVRAVA